MTTATVNSLINKCFSRLLLALALSAPACEALAEVVLTPLPGSTPQTTRPYAGTPLAIGVRATEDGVPVSGLPVTFEPSGSFVVSASSSRITVNTDASGIAMLPAPGLTAGPTAGTYSWFATASDASARFDLTVAGGFPYSVSVMSGAGQGVAAGQRLARPLSARVVGSDGLPVPYALVQFCFPDPSTPSVSVPGTTVYYATADANGLATSPVLTANSVMGTNQVMAATPNTLELAPAERRAYFDFSIFSRTSVTPLSVTSSSAPPPSVPTVDAQGLWWNPRENGTGLSVVAHGDTLFVALYIYDEDGEPTWVVMPGGSWDPTFTAYSGALYRSSGGPSFYGYDAASLAAGPAGTLTITFQDDDHARIEYTINGVSGFKLVERYSFDNGPATQPDHSDLYWGGPSQHGWGMTVMQQGSTLFVLWFTYDADGAPVWYAMPGGSWTANDTYEGRIYRTHSSAWLGASYDASKFEAIDVGSFRIQFSGGTASFTYTADGHSGTMQLVREPF
ncbi:MAG TPA: hypothetical protein VLT89_02725 [Usitatibacter sp.]|nr:hypothetical protein [Usitatibacter sp.]